MYRFYWGPIVRALALLYSALETAQITLHIVKASMKPQVATYISVIHVALCGGLYIRFLGNSKQKWFDFVNT
jgi:hypothetical protein